MTTRAFLCLALAAAMLLALATTADGAKQARMPKGNLDLGGALGSLFNGGAQGGPAGECVFRCRKSKVTPVQRTGYQPKANGCGVGGMTVKLGDVDFTSCCNSHDVCYGTCGRCALLPSFSPILLPWQPAMRARGAPVTASQPTFHLSHDMYVSHAAPFARSKADCDSEFSACMKSICHKLGSESCSSSASMYHMGVSTMGCNPYLESQKEACDCDPEVAQRVKMKHKATAEL